VASLSQGRTAAAQCGLFTHKSVPVIFEPPCTISTVWDPFCKESIYVFHFSPFRCPVQKIYSLGFILGHEISLQKFLFYFIDCISTLSYHTGLVSQMIPFLQVLRMCAQICHRKN